MTMWLKLSVVSAVSLAVSLVTAAPVAAAHRPDAARTTGRYLIAPGTDPAAGVGRIIRYSVEVEQGLSVDADMFAVYVGRILNDPLGWGQGGRTLRFVRVSSGRVNLRVSLSSPALTDKECAPLQTDSAVSCFQRGRAVINSDRWLHGSPTYGHDLRHYRFEVINHEVGHALGHHHVHCPYPGAPAPVMVQQTKSLEGCRPNWLPYGAGPATARG